MLNPLLLLVDLSDKLSVRESATLTSCVDVTKVSWSFNDPDDILRLQDDPNAIYKGADANYMHFNGAKFQAVCYHPTNKPYTVTPELESVRVLGIQLSNDATFHEYIALLATLYGRVADRILRIFRNSNRDTMHLHWRIFTHCRLNYYAQLWSPENVKLIAELEAIQCHFSKRIDAVKHMGHWERSREMGL